ncbi:MAG: hypothetical protein J1E29_00115 [Duncaniella sp.]|nr:hypothetical protein [Duncaniella sp.]
MKKFLLSFATAVMATFAASAATETFTCSSLGGANIQPMTDVTIGNAVTLSFAKGSGSNDPGYFNNGKDIRLYANNSMTVTAAEGYKVEKLVFTISDNSQLAAVSASLGTVAPQAQGDTQLTWTGDASKFTLSIGAKADFGTDTNKAGQLRFKAVEVTYSAGQGQTEPDEPETPTETPHYTVAEALDLISKGFEGDAQVTGVISEIQEVNTSFGNATYFIKDALTDEASLEVYRGYYLDGTKFTDANQIAVGGKVTVDGKLVNYNGTYEFTSGSKILEYTAPEVDPDQPDVPTEESVTFDFTKPSLFSADYSDEGESNDEYILDGESFTNDVVTISFAATEDASSKPRFYYGTGSNAGWTLRFYKDNTVTLACDEGYKLTSIKFNGTNLTGWTISNGALNGSTWTPEGTVNTVSFSKEATGSNPAIKTMTVYYAPTSSALTAIEAADSDAPVEYFNLQGIRVANPEGGIFIRRQGNTVTKVIR